MSKSILGLFITAILVLSALAGLAAADDGYGITLVTKGTSGYILQDLGVEASGKPGGVTDLAITKGHWTFDWWERAGSDKGEYGDRGFGDEHDLTVTRNDRLGKFALETSAAYFFLAPFGGNNDGIQFYVDLGRPFKLGYGVTVTPALRVIEFVGLDAMPTFTLIRYRMPITVPILKELTLVFDPSVTWNATPAAGQYDVVFRPTESIVWQATKALSIQLDVKHASHVPAEIDLGLTFKF